MLQTLKLNTIYSLLNGDLNYFNQYQVTWTHKWLEMHGCELSTVATDALVLKHHAISIHSVDK